MLIILEEFFLFLKIMTKKILFPNLIFIAHIKSLFFQLYLSIKVVKSCFSVMKWWFWVQKHSKAMQSLSILKILYGATKSSFCVCLNILASLRFLYALLYSNKFHVYRISLLWDQPDVMIECVSADSDFTLRNLETNWTMGNSEQSEGIMPPNLKKTWLLYHSREKPLL